ncbi:HAD-IIA family hydrolase [Celerinatantimonas sp. YJH-8]|uniref:HAD-IIA family hydrolase n=1 Tax=Celerinatantimonas sp. YJH-8 TaxID=3228714 RepID=UPI0038BFC35A
MINSPAEAFTAYLNMGMRLPKFNALLSTNNSTISLERITDIIDDIDAFFFDGYGVLNIGSTAISGASASITALQQAGKAVYVVTNAATQNMDALVKKYHDFGFLIKKEMIVNSREVMMTDFVTQTSFELSIGVIVPELYRPVTMNYHEIYPENEAFWDADVFLFLSGQNWNSQRQDRWLEALYQRPRPIWVGNADLIAPLEQGVSHEPGSYTLTLPDELYRHVHCYGKPFQPIFERALNLVKKQYGYEDRSRMVMVGDTLHTDILGAAAMGMKTALATGFGFLRHLDVNESIRQSGIVPDYLLSSI